MAAQVLFRSWIKEPFGICLIEPEIKAILTIVL